MKFLRITKYNPKYRDVNDIYTKYEWTSVSDVGNIFNNKTFTIIDYLSFENLYVSAIMMYMNYYKVEFVYIKGLEKRKFKLNKIEKNFFNWKFKFIYLKVKNNSKIKSINIDIVCRLILREKIWCRLESKQVFIHFGYDYNMYVGAKNKDESIIDKVKSLGLYVEEIDSPYFDN